MLEASFVEGTLGLTTCADFASDPGLADEARGFASDPGLADEARGFASDPGLADEARGFASGPSVLGGFASPDPIDRERDFGSSAPSDPR